MQRTAPLLIKYVGSTSKQVLSAAYLAATDIATDAMEKKVGRTFLPHAQGHPSDLGPRAWRQHFRRIPVWDIY
jgi:hypothetical protein